MVVCEYVNNPLLLDGYKFDLRVYVALTSINPLRVYIYEDGLARFATQKYHLGSNGNLKQQKYVHLTNYSLNKHNANFQNNTDAENDGQGPGSLPFAGAAGKGAPMEDRSLTAINLVHYDPVSK